MIRSVWWLAVIAWIPAAAFASPAAPYPPVLEACPAASVLFDGTDAERLGFNGPIKHATVKPQAILARREFFDFDEVGRLTDHALQGGGRPLLHRTERVHDHAGRVVEERFYRWDKGALPDTGLVRHSRFDYDGDEIIEMRLATGLFQPTRIDHRCDGDDVVRLHHFADGSIVEERLVVETDGEGRPTRVTRRVAGEIVPPVREIRYGGTGWRTVSERWGEALVTRTSERHDAEGRLLERVQHLIDGSDGIRVRHVHDESGRLTDVIEYDEGGDVRLRSEFIYGDDEADNWIRRIEHAPEREWYLYRILTYHR